MSQLKTLKANGKSLKEKRKVGRPKGKQKKPSQVFSDISGDMFQYIQQYETVHRIVLNFFKGDIVKANLWMDSPNPMLGEVSPKDMIVLGGYDRLLKFIKFQLEEGGHKMSNFTNEPLRIVDQIIAKHLGCKVKVAEAGYDNVDFVCTCKNKQHRDPNNGNFDDDDSIKTWTQNTIFAMELLEGNSYVISKLDNDDYHCTMSDTKKVNRFGQGEGKTFSEAIVNAYINENDIQVIKADESKSVSKVVSKNIGKKISKKTNNQPVAAMKARRRRY